MYFVYDFIIIIIIIGWIGQVVKINVTSEKLRIESSGISEQEPAWQ